MATSAAAHPAALARLKIERDVIMAMQKPGLLYWALVGFFATVFGVFLLGAWAYQIYKGIGVGGQRTRSAGVSTSSISCSGSVSRTRGR